MADSSAALHSAPGEAPVSRRASTLPTDAPTTATEGAWLTFLCLTLLGYTLLGKGWAYVGVPPLFVGEAVLLCGVVSFVLFGRWRGILDLPAAWFLLLFAAWGLLRTWSDLPRYGASALRDAAIWG